MITWTGWNLWRFCQTSFKRNTSKKVLSFQTFKTVRVCNNFSTTFGHGLPELLLCKYLLSSLYYQYSAIASNTMPSFYSKHFSNVHCTVNLFPELPVLWQYKYVSTSLVIVLYSMQDKHSSPTLDCRPLSHDCQPPFLDGRSLILDCRSLILDCLPLSLDCRLPSLDCQPRSLDC